MHGLEQIVSINERHEAEGIAAANFTSRKTMLIAWALLMMKKMMLVAMVAFTPSTLLAGTLREEAVAVTQVTLHLLTQNPLPSGPTNNYECDECQDTGLVGDQKVPCQFCDRGKKYRQIAELQDKIAPAIEEVRQISMLIDDTDYPGYTKRAFDGPAIVVVSGEFCGPCLILKKRLVKYRGIIHVCVVDNQSDVGKYFLSKSDNPRRPLIPQTFLVKGGKILFKFGTDSNRVVEFMERCKGVQDMDAAILEFLDGYKKKVIKTVIEEGTQRKAAKKLGRSQSTVAGYVKRARDQASKRGYAPEYDRNHPTPATEFISGVSSFYNADGELAGQWVKTKASHQNFLEKLEIFANQLAESTGKASPSPPPSVDFRTDIATHIKIGDQHLGLYAWGKENGDEDYDIEKSTSDVIGGINYLIEASEPCGRCVLVNVGDFFHANGASPLTPSSGNVLDVDGRYGMVARRGSHILKTAIDMCLAKHQTVDVINARGNHDPDSAVWVDIVLEAHFSDEPRVKIYNNDSKWIAWEFGKTAVFVNHGERKPQQQYEYITNRFRDIVGRSLYVYADNGHVHHKQSHEIGAVKFEVWNPLVAADAYHSDNSYGASRSITSVTYHKEFGEVSRNICDLRMIRSAYA